MMKELDDITLKQISDYLTNKIVEEFGVSKSLAKKLLVNVIAYNVVVESIMEQVDFLLDPDNFQG